VTKPDVQIEKFDLRSEDITKARRQELLRIFPEAHSESGGINFEALRLSLGDAVESGPEGFGMSWPGKAECAKTIQRQSVATLLPVEEESVNWDTTQNVIIEGDNLEVLKVLQKAYLGKVKLIYIDPPYNTGNDFIYPDNFSESLNTYLQYTNQVDSQGRKFSTNTEASGRFHSKWMNMMYPRLILARDLLKEDGLIAVSIDDHEVDNLKKLLNNVFGEESFINQIVVKSSESSGVKMSHVDKRLPKIKEYVLLYGKNPSKIMLSPVEVPKVGASLDKYMKYYSTVIENFDDPVESWKLTPVSEYLKNNGKPHTKADVDQFKQENAHRVVYRTNNSSLSNLSFETKTARVVSATGIEYIWWEGKQMLFLSEYLTEKICDLWTDISTINLNKETLGIDCFSNGQKPLALVQRLLKLVTSADDLVVDFFAGSGTTGHAIMLQNVEDKANRRFILVQLPERIDEGSPEFDAGFESISKITLERVRRCSQEVGGSAGFRTFALHQSNFSIWDADSIEGNESKLEEQLFAQVEHVLPGRTNKDILFELMLKSRYELTTQVERVKVGTSEVWKVAGGELVAIIDSGLTIEVIREVARWKPESVVILDRCFGGDDSLKANARKIFEDANVDLKTV
jgi:adenine-specific DNA-methyltransferase